MEIKKIYNKDGELFHEYWVDESDLDEVFNRLGCPDDDERNKIMDILSHNGCILRCGRNKSELWGNGKVITSSINRKDDVSFGDLEKKQKTRKKKQFGISKG